MNQNLHRGITPNKTEKGTKSMPNRLIKEKLIHLFNHIFNLFKSPKFVGPISHSRIIFLLIISKNVLHP